MRYERIEMAERAAATPDYFKPEDTEHEAMSYLPHVPAYRPVSISAALSEISHYHRQFEHRSHQHGNPYEAEPYDGLMSADFSDDEDDFTIYDDLHEGYEDVLGKEPGGHCSIHEQSQLDGFWKPNKLY